MLHPESGGTPPKTLGQIRHSRGIIGAWHDSYLIKVDGSGRVTQRNRRFLRKFVPASPIVGAPHRPIWNIPARELDTAPVVTIPSNTTVAPTTAVNIRDDHTAELRNEPEQVQEELVIDLLHLLHLQQSYHVQNEPQRRPLFTNLNLGNGFHSRYYI